MSSEQATRRFYKVFIPAMAVYLAGTMLTNGLSGRGDVSIVTQYALALIPIIAIFVAFWAHWRFAVELDEFLRLIQIKGTLFGVACVMIVASSWGQLELLADTPRLPIFWLLPIFWSAQGLAVVFISNREGVLK